MNKLKKLKCLRCGHVWTPQVEKPKKCARRRCGSPYYDRPRQLQKYIDLHEKKQLNKQQ